MRTTITLDDDLAVRLERYRRRLGESFKRVLNEAVRVGLNELEEQAEVTHEVRRTKPLRLGQRLGGSIDNIGEALAVVEGEDFRLCTSSMRTSLSTRQIRIPRTTTRPGTGSTSRQRGCRGQSACPGRACSPINGWSPTRACTRRRPPPRTRGSASKTGWPG